MVFATIIATHTNATLTTGTAVSAQMSKTIHAMRLNWPIVNVMMTACLFSEILTIMDVEETFAIQNEHVIHL